MILPPPSPFELRRDRAILQDRLTCEASSLIELWSSLRSFEERIIDAFFSSERCFLLLERNREPPRALAETQRRVLEHILAGRCQKFLVIELGIAASTVALHSRQSLRAVGLTGKPSRCHPLPMLAAMASRLNAESWRAASSTLVDDGRTLRVVSVARPEIQLSRTLPRAEFEVLRGLVEGLCYEEISQQRRTSRRTVANQVSSLFRRFHVSGRNELVWHLWGAAMRNATTLPPVSESTAAVEEPSALGSQCA